MQKNNKFKPEQHFQHLATLNVSERSLKTSAINPRTPCNTECLLRLGGNHPPTTVAWDAFRQLTLKGQETPCWLCFPTFHFTAPSSSFFVWRKPNNGANVSFFSSLSGEQALPLCMPLLFSQWYCAPQQHWLGKNLFHYTHNLCCGCYGGNRSIMCCQTT